MENTHLRSGCGSCQIEIEMTRPECQTRLDRLRLGNFGDARSLGKGLSELRIDSGPGYRVYFMVEGKSAVVLFCGGDKTTQQKDIRRAREYLKDYRRRPDA
jgi:putative addiction module killer protein